MPNPATQKAILAAIEAQLPDACTTIRTAEILPGDWFEMLSPQGQLPLAGVIDGGARCDDELDPISTYFVTLAIFTEIAGRPRLAVMGTTKHPGMIDLSAEVSTGMAALGDLGVAGVFSYGQPPDFEASEAGQFDPDNPRRLALRKRLRFWFKVNEY
jgi:hypothetical protein